MQITGPGAGGSGVQIAVIDSEGRLHTHATIVHEDKVANEDGRYWSIDIPDIDPVGANDYFLYIKNTGIVDLGLTDWRLSSNAATRVDIDWVDGVPAYVGATAVTPSSRKLGSGREPDATINLDTDITNLTKSGRLFKIELDTAGKMFQDTTTSNIIIPQGKAIAFKRVAVSGVIDGTISLIQYNGD